MSATAQSDTVYGLLIYGEYCASSHGANLEGQPDWMERLPSGRLPAPRQDQIG